jgi:hypothetical protein
MKHRIELTTEEMLCIAQSTERNLQNAIDNNIPRRILFYTNMRNKIQLALSGPVAQRSEQGTHNPLVAGSNPAGSTTIITPKQL